MNKLLLIAAAAFAMLNFAFISREVAAPADAFESPLDGAWSGMVTVDGGIQPAVLNLNISGDGGAGYLLLPADPEKSIEDFSAFPLSDVTAGATTLSFVFAADGGTPKPSTSVSATLKLNAKTHGLEGTLKSKNKQFKSVAVSLLPVDGAAPESGLWTGDNLKGKPVILHVVPGKKSLGGTVIVDGRDGAMTNGKFDGKVLAGGADTGDDTWSFSLKFNSKKQLLKGKFADAVNASFPAKLRKAASLGKAMKLFGADPLEVTVDAADPNSFSTVLTFTGVNFAPGTLLHSLDPAFAISTDSIGKNAITGTLTIPANVADGALFGVLIAAPDGQSVEKADAVLIHVHSDDNGGGDGGGQPTVSFANDIQPIFSNNCIFCHGNSGGLSLESGAAYNNIVNQKANGNASFFRISPGDPDNSYLVMKVKGDSRAGQRMPLGGPFLDQATIDKIVTWVNEGALNN